MKGTLIFDDDSMREVIQMIVEGMLSGSSNEIHTRLTDIRQVGGFREDGNRTHWHSRNCLEGV